MFYTVSLENLKYQARHGIYTFEKEKDNAFLLSISIIFYLPDNYIFENLEQTYNYENISNIASKYMSTPTDLLETVCQKIANEIRETNTFPGLEKVRISLSKQNPPIGVECEASKVEMEF